MLNVIGFLRGYFVPTFRLYEKNVVKKEGKKCLKFKDYIIRIIKIIMLRGSKRGLLLV